LYTMKNQVEAYQNVQSYSPQEIPSEVLVGIVTKAKGKYPDDYEMQLYTIEQQVKAY